MKVGIIGFGTEGQVSYEYWQRQGAQLTILDANPHVVAPTAAKTVLGPGYLDDLSGYDLLVRSPGVRPQELATDAPVTTATREFFAQCPVPIIGVTGTKGKGTTSTLIKHILEAAGRRVWLGGNIGRAALEFLPDIEAHDLVVLELSSFQLIDLDRSPQVGVCLMVVPDHMDWHADMDEYVRAKGNIARYQSTHDRMVYLARNQYSRQIAELSPGFRVPYMAAPGAQVVDGAVVMEGQTICRVEEVGLLGPHNLENVCAAVTATWELVHKRTEVIAQAVRNFRGLPFRLEPVAEIDGVRYINDSFSVNQYATIAAINSFEPAHEVLILGGYKRGIDLRPMTEAVAKARPRQVVVLGQTGMQIKDQLEALGYRHVVHGGSSMTGVVTAARSAARPGDVVLLSPGCPSFDMFKDYKDRGRQFAQAVQALLQKGQPA